MFTIHEHIITCYEFELNLIQGKYSRCPNCEKVVVKSMSSNPHAPSSLSAYRLSLI